MARVLGTIAGLFGSASYVVLILGSVPGWVFGCGWPFSSKASGCFSLRFSDQLH
jgi:hypothetical protein